MTEQRVMFVGKDNYNVDTLWVSDGSAAGTVPLTGIANTDASLSSGLFSVAAPYFTSFNGLVYFSGADAAGVAGLWRTDGTAAGTKEITGIAGTNAAGLNVAYMVVFNGKLYFQGVNAAGQSGLWMSDGSAAGTQEVTGIANTYQGNIIAYDPLNGLTPEGLFVFNGHLLFGGVDAAGHEGIWSSDGTGAGTTVFSSTATGGVSAPLFLGVVNGDLMFQAVNAAGINGLWKLAPGGVPQQVTGITGANANGVFSGSSINHDQFAILNNIMLFQGNDASGNPSLFQYNGATGAAQQLTGITNAYNGGSGFQPWNFVVYNGKILFEAADAKFVESLWQSDGTATGTTDVTPLNGQDFAAVNGKLLFVDNYVSLGSSDGTATGTKPLTIAGDNYGSLYPGSLTTVTLACFAEGTRILTARGEVAVESLAIGEHVLTQAGRLVPIRWLGHRRTDCRAHPVPTNAWPVRVRAGAFGEGLPVRDLFLSPDHAVFVDGALIPVRYLINGATVVQEPRDTVTYWHVELDRHAVILAERLPCESFLDTGNRAAFDNGGPAVQMHPDFALSVWDAKACAPLVRTGPRLTAAKQRLLAQAAALGHATTDDANLRVLVSGRARLADIDGLIWRVRLPEATQHVRLASGIWRPAHVRPAEHDTRSLGVAIARLWLDRREVSLDSPGFRAGWHAPEPGWRWTDGNATLALAGARELAFEVAMTGTYWRHPRHRKARAAKPAASAGRNSEAPCAKASQWRNDEAPAGRA